MNGRRKQLRSAFTLVELLIVIIIIGLLATLVMSVVGRSLKDARRVSTETAANEARQAISLYRQYTGQLPDLITSWDPLTTRTTTPDGRTIGPFLPEPPKNMVVAANPSAIADGDADVLYTDAGAFLYDYNGGNGTGRLIAALEPAP